MTLQDQDLLFRFDDALNETRFDDGSHKPTSIQPVDFIVEFEGCYRFVEVKDPDMPGAGNPAAIKKKLASGELVKKLAGKYRDSCFFFGLQGHAPKKMEYVVLLSMEELDDGLLVSKTDELQKAIPHRHKSWRQPSASVCVILNMKQWKKRYGDDSVWRASDYP